MELHYKATSLVDEDDLMHCADTLEPYLSHLKEVYENLDYEAQEASLCLPRDGEIMEDVLEAVSAYAETLRFVFVIGIGGSSLGTQAVYEALKSSRSEDDPELFFIDTMSPSNLRAAAAIIRDELEDSEELLVNIVSKSGKTLETTANAEILLGLLREEFGEVNDRVVVTTGAETPLAEWAKERGIRVLSIPEMVGGRFSVFSPVGLFPLGLAGIDIEALVRGANVQAEISLDPDLEGNAALVSASAVFLNWAEGSAIHDHFFFAPELEHVGKWCRQLVAESLGKQFDLEGEEANRGITPTVSIGPNDLHSSLQLALGGPKDKFTTFVRAKAPQAETFAVPEDADHSFGAAYLQGKTADEFLDAIYEGATDSYSESGLPFIEIDMRELNEHSLGIFLQFKMIETMLLGRLMEVDAFDQPAVESYKKEARRLLGE
ncbi:MAG TPA: hypothetical protein VHF05_01910 [Candidatus Paceibacterota bacterium]|jgi:glucose-6-phosphate isomerase|nr:hypothetical protein [Candidatus Paceibacterota bacterium]